MPVSKPSTSPDPYCRAGLTMPEFVRRIGCSMRKGYRIITDGEVRTYMVAGKRRVDPDSADLYIERCKNLGPRFEPPVTGKRKPGRPRKAQQQPSAASAAE
jgi:hypothetical protein